MVIPCAHVGAPACAQLAHYPNPGVVYLDHDIVGGGAREMPHLESVEFLVILRKFGIQNRSLLKRVARFLPGRTQ